MQQLPLTGQTLGRFLLQAELGQGGMAVVYRAYQTDLERTVALKVLRPELLYDTEAVTRFEREARSAAKLQHPNIVTIHEIGTLEPEQSLPLHYIALHYIAGSTVKELIEAQGRLDLAQTINLLTQVGTALSYAHQQDVIHRDVKPSNILVSADGTAYLSDFGLAYQIGQAGVTRTGVVMGTPEYMAPEQVEGHAALGPATDIYALGVVLYEMLTGAVPFESDTPMGMAVARLMQAPRPITELRDDLPPQVEVVLSRALARDPAERFASVAEFVAALHSIDTHQPATTSQALQMAVANTGPTLALSRPEAEAPEPAPASDGQSTSTSSTVTVSGQLAMLTVLGLMLIITIAAFVFIPTINSNSDIPTPVVDNPTNPPSSSANPEVAALIERGWTDLAEERYNDAEQAFEQAGALDPDNTEALYGLGRVALAQQDYDTAITFLTEAVRMDNRIAVHHLSLAEAYLRRSEQRDQEPTTRELAAADRTQAAESYRRALSLSGDLAAAYTGLGWVSYYETQYDEARQQFEQAIALNETQPEAHNGLGWTLYILEDYSAARERFQRALNLDPTYVNAYYGAGLALEGMNLPGQARTLYEQGLEEDPDYAPILERLELYD